MADSINIQLYFIHMKTSLLLVKGWKCWAETHLVAFYDKQRTQSIYSNTSRKWTNQLYVNVYIKILGCVHTFFLEIKWCDLYDIFYAEYYLKIAEVSMKIEKSNNIYITSRDTYKILGHFMDLTPKRKTIVLQFHGSSSTTFMEMLHH